jgi:hypothetical protein
VITSGVVAITTTGWTVRQSAKRARETRLAESYLEVLRLVEREGQWVDARVTNCPRVITAAMPSTLVS